MAGECSKPPKEFVFKDGKFETQTRTILSSYMIEIEKEYGKYKRNIGRKRLDKKPNDIRFGTAGIAFMFHKLASINNPIQGTQVEAVSYSEAAAKGSDERECKKMISLLDGDAGVYIIRAAVLKLAQKPFQAELEKIREGLKLFHDPEYLKNGRSEMMEGRCGYVLGVLWLQKRLKNVEILTVDELSSLAKTLIASGRDYSSDYKLKIPLMYQYDDREYIGALHGLSTILFTLLKLPLNPKDLNDVKISIDMIVDLQNKEGLFPIKYNERNIKDIGDPLHLTWSYGAPGVFFLIAKAYEKFREDKYLLCCRRIGELVWERGLLNKKFGLSEGIAGCGYIHLLLYRLTKETEYFRRAREYAEFFYSIKKNNKKEDVRNDVYFVPKHHVSLLEGISGMLCFFADVLYPGKAEFPFMDIFD